MILNSEELTTQFLLPLWNDRTLDVIDTFVSPKADIKTTFVIGKGPSALKQNVKTIFSAFSALELTIKEAIQYENQFIYKWTGTALHTGPVLNIKPTGKKIIFTEIISGAIVDESIVTYHSFSDIPRVLASTIPLPLDRSNAMSSIRMLTGRRLTRREIEALSFWLKGFSIKDSAKAMGGLSKRTVQTFRENIKRKLHVETFQELFSFIQACGIMPLFLK